MTLRPYLELRAALEQGHDLSVEASAELCAHWLSEELSDAEVAEGLGLLADKGESASEIVGFVRALSERATPLRFAPGVVDVCGTGGSGLTRFNVSTCVAFVLAAGGLRVAKHGNRGSRRANGSFDLLEELGLPVLLDAEKVARCLGECGLGFLFAPQFHPALARVKAARALAARRTIFNLAGPLSNPARVTHQVVGVSSEGDVERIAESLRQLGREAVVVCGAPGIDEVSLSGSTTLVQVGREKTTRRVVLPEDFGSTAVDYSRLPGGDAVDNAPLFMEILRGQGHPALVALVSASAGVALYCAGSASSIAQGAILAGELLNSGKVEQKFDEYRSVLTRVGAS